MTKEILDNLKVIMLKVIVIKAHNDLYGSVYAKDIADHEFEFGLKIADISFKAGLINGALDKCEIDTKEINKMLKEQFKAGQESRDLKCGSCKVGGNIDGFVNLCIMCSDRLDEELKQKAQQDTARKIFEEIEDRITNARYDDIKMLIRQLKSKWRN